MLRLFLAFAIASRVSSKPIDDIKANCLTLESGSKLFTESVATKFNSDDSGAAKGGYGVVKLMTLAVDPLKPNVKNVPVAVKKIQIGIPQQNSMTKSQFDEQMSMAEYEIELVLKELRTSLDVSILPMMMRTYNCMYYDKSTKSFSVFLTLERMTSESIDYNPGNATPGVDPAVVSAFEKLTVSQKMNTLLSVAEQLQVLHTTLKKCHNDIKPANIMFTNSAATAAKLIDFGGATACTEEISIFTEGYIDVDATNDGKSHAQNDIWALGLTFGQIIIGELTAEIAYDAPVKKMKYLLTSAKFTRHKQVRDAVLEAIQKKYKWAAEHGGLSFLSLIKKMAKMKRESRMKKANCLVSWLEFLVWATNGADPKSNDYKTKAAAVCKNMRAII